MDKGFNDEDNKEFLNMIKRSEYRVVEQLQQTPSKISFMYLLLNSEKHHESIMKILSATHITSDHDLPPQGRAYNKALHIFVYCGKTYLSKVLVDIRSSLNVMSKTSLMKIAMDGLVIRPSNMVVKAFDGSQSPVFGEVDLPIVIGLDTFYITFQVMDIEPTYTCLLGRPWIPLAGAVTSTLHQKMKFMVEGTIVIIDGV